MASSNDELQKMLEGLSRTKSLNTQAPVSTATATRQKAQLGLRDYALTSIQNAPSLSARISSIAAGKPEEPSGLSKVLFDNPISKTVLNALTVMDTPRRATISAVREIADALDNDPTTQAKFGDFISQVKDPAYGFGTAFPIKGWKGRIIGFLGDVALDPVAWATLGSTAYAKAAVKGGELTTRRVIGKTLVGPEARLKMGAYAEREMRKANLVANASKYSDSEIQRIAGKISANGKLAFNTELPEIAKSLGIPKPGVYYLGSRVRLPFSGPIATALESGLTKARLGIANTRPAEAILKKITRTGTGGALAPLSSEYVRSARMGLARGTLKGSEITDALRLLTFDENRRIATTFARQKAETLLKPLIVSEQILKYRESFSRLLDNPTQEVLASASVGERNAADQVRQVLTSMHDEVMKAMKDVDEGFSMGKVDEYFPWMLSDEAMKKAMEENSTVAEYIKKYQKIDVNDVAGSFKSRNIRAGQEFFDVKELAQDQLNARSLNEIARKTLGFDMFETDGLKVLAKYAENFSEQMGNAAFFSSLKSQPDMMDFIKTSFQVAPEFLESLSETRGILLKQMNKDMQAAESTLSKLSTQLGKELGKAEKIATKDVAKSAQFVPTAEDIATQMSTITKLTDEMQQHLQMLNSSRGEAFKDFSFTSTAVSQLQTDLLDIENRMSKIPQQVMDGLDLRLPRPEQGLVENITQGAFAETADVVSDITPEKRIAVAKDIVDELSSKLRRTYVKFQNLNSFHNELPFIEQHITEARLNMNGSSFVDNLSKEMGFKYYEDIYPEQPIKTISQSRFGKTLWQDAVDSYWSTGAREADPSVAIIKSKLDPLNVIKGNKLKQLSEEDIRKIIIRGTTTADNALALQEVVAWITLRELKFNTGLKELMAGTVEAADKTSTELFTRISKLNELTVKGSEMNRILRAINVDTNDLERLGREAVISTTEEGKEASRFIFLEDKQYVQVLDEIKSIDEQINDILTENALLFEDTPIVQIDKAFNDLLSNRVGVVLDNEIDDILQSLDNFGYNDISSQVEEMRGVITYEQMKQLLDGFKEIELDRVSQVAAGKLTKAEEFGISELLGAEKITSRTREQMKSEIDKLNALKSTKEKQKNDIYGKMSQKRQDAHNTLQMSGGYQDFVKQYSDSALELYTYSETGLQFRRLSELYAPFGITPDLGVWVEIRADIAGKMYGSAVEFEQGFNKAVEQIQKVQQIVQAKPASEQYGFLRQEMENLFESKDGEYVRRYFPEFELVLNQRQMSDFSRLREADPEVSGIKDQLQAMYHQLIHKNESGRRIQQATQVTGSDRITEAEARKTSAVIGSMRASTTSSADARAAKIASQNAAPSTLINEIEDMLFGDAPIRPTAPSVMTTSTYSLKSGINYIDDTDFENVLNQLKSNLEKAESRIREGQRLARSQAKSQGLPVGRKASAALGASREARTSGLSYGFAGLFREAVRPSNSATKVRKFFGELVGGTFAYSNVADVQQQIIATEGREIRQAQRIVNLTFDSSYAGRTSKYVGNRKTALRNIMDSQFPVTEEQLKSGIIPNISGSRRASETIWGPLAYADSLEENAKRLIREIAQDETFAKQIQQLGIKIEDMQKGLPLTNEQISAIENLIEQQPEKIVGTSLWKYIDEDESVIKSLPKDVQDKVFEYRDLKIQAERIRNDEFMPFAQREKELYDVIAELAPLNLHNIYDATGTPSFDPFSTYGKQVWNKPRPGVVDIDGNPILSNVDSSLLDTYFQNWDKPSRQPRGLNHRVYHMEEVPFSPTSFTIDKESGREITNLIFVDAEGVVMKDLPNGETAFQQARNAYNRREPFTTLKPIQVRSIGEGELIANTSSVLQNSKVLSGDVYDPAKTWVFLSGESQVLDEATKSFTVKEALPEIAVPLPINKNKASSVAFAYPLGPNGGPLSFTKMETDALFNPPIIKDEFTITKLERDIATLESERPKVTRTSPQSLKNKAKKIDAQISAIRKEINTRFERPNDVKHIPQLEREIRDWQKRVPELNFRGAYTGDKKKLIERARHEIEIRVNQIQVIRSRATAEDKVRTIITLVMDNPDIAFSLKAVKRYGDTPDSPVQAIRNMVKGMLHSSTPDGTPVSVAQDILDMRKNMVKSRFRSEDSGIMFDELAKAETAMKQSQLSGLRNDVKTKLLLIQEQQDIVKKIRAEWDEGSATADVLEDIEGTLSRAGKQLKSVTGEPAFKQPEAAAIGRLPRSVGNLRSDVSSAKSKINSLKSQRNSFMKEVNQNLNVLPQSVRGIAKENVKNGRQVLEGIEDAINLDPDVISRIQQIQDDVFPRFDQQIAEQQQIISGIQSEISGYGAKATLKTSEEVLKTAEEIKNAKLNKSLSYVKTTDNTLTKIRQEFGETSKQFRQYRDLYLTLDLQNKNFNELQAAMKKMSDITAGQKILDAKSGRYAQMGESLRLAQIQFDTLVYGDNWARANAVGSQVRLDEIKGHRDKLVNLNKLREENFPEAVKQFDMFFEEVKPVLELIGDGSISEPLAMILNQHVDSLSAYHASVLAYGDSNAQSMVAKGIDMMYKGLPAKPANDYSALAYSVPATERKNEGQVINGIELLKEFNKGWVAIGNKFPNMQITPELAEIFNNGHRLREPVIAQELSKYLGAYTRFFKAYATLSPGFHVRNAISNGLATFFGGGNPIYLNEGLQVSMKWNKAFNEGKTWEQFVAKLPAEQARRAEGARMSVAASGGGFYSDLEKELRKGGRLTNNKLTNWSRMYGEISDNHARFVFGYDALAQGMDYSFAAARTKRFFIDYTDLSDLDKSMRQIVPFWMWTSRNLPTQITNMWFNPKPYQIYNSIKRNISDDSDSELVPAYLNEIGAFKLPFGDNLFFTLDTGFNQAERQINELRDPTRLMSNLNPLIRLPIELAGNRQLFSNRQFSPTPVKVEGTAANILQPLLQSIGWGQTNEAGEKFVSDKPYYTARNIAPFLGTLERLNPTIATGRDRGTTNQWLGFTGAPIRKVTPDMQASALNELKRRIQEQVATNTALEGE